MAERVSLQAEIQRFHTEENILVEESHVLGTEVERLSQHNEVLQREYADLKSQVDIYGKPAVAFGLLEDAQRAKDEADSARKDAESQAKSLQDALHTKRAESMAERDSLEAKLQRFHTENKVLAEEKHLLRAEAERLSDHSKVLQGEYADFKSQVDAHDAVVHKQSLETLECQSEHDALARRYGALKQEHDRIVAQANASYVHLEELQLELEAHRAATEVQGGETLQQAQVRLDQQVAQRECLEKKYEELRQHNDQLFHQAESHKAEAEVQLMERDALQAKHTALTEEHALLRTQFDETFNLVMQYMETELDSARGELEKDGVETTYLYKVHHAEFQALSNGIGYRLSPDWHDMDGESYAEWGSLVEGVPVTDGTFIQVGTRYLPKYVQDESGAGLHLVMLPIGISTLVPSTLPLASAEPQQLRVTILGATNLWDSSLARRPDLYCVCQIPGRQDFLFQTAVVGNNPNPNWNEEFTIDSFAVGDRFDFTIMNQDNEKPADDMLGRAVLSSERFLPDGFDGVLHLLGDCAASIVVKVEVLSSSPLPTGQNMSLSSPAPLENDANLALQVETLKLRAEHTLHVEELKGCWEQTRAAENIVATLRQEIEEHRLAAEVVKAEHEKCCVEHNAVTEEHRLLSFEAEQLRVDRATLVVQRQELELQVQDLQEQMRVFRIERETCMAPSGADEVDKMRQELTKSVEETVAAQAEVTRLRAENDALSMHNRELGVVARGNSVTSSFSPQQPECREQAQHPIHVAERWVAGYKGPPVTTPSLCYMSKYPVKFDEFRSFLLTAASADAPHRERMAHDLPTGSLMQRMLSLYKAHDKHGKGYLEWNNGEICAFLEAALQDQGLSQLSQSQMFQLYETFDCDRNAKLDVHECLCLCDALFRSVFFCMETSPVLAGQATPHLQHAVAAPSEMDPMQAMTTTQAGVSSSRSPRAPLPSHLMVTVVGARGLQASEPYCICKIPEKPESQFQTEIAAVSSDVDHHPTWNEEFEISSFVPGDALEFVIMLKEMWPKWDEILGTATLAGEQFYPKGFQGEIALEGTQPGATVSVQIAVLSGAGGVPMQESEGAAELQGTAMTMQDGKTRLPPKQDQPCVPHSPEKALPVWEAVPPAEPAVPAPPTILHERPEASGSQSQSEPIGQPRPPPGPSPAVRATAASATTVFGDGGLISRGANPSSVRASPIPRLAEPLQLQPQGPLALGPLILKPKSATSFPSSASHAGTSGAGAARVACMPAQTSLSGGRTPTQPVAYLTAGGLVPETLPAQVTYLAAGGLMPEGVAYKNTMLDTKVIQAQDISRSVLSAGALTVSGRSAPVCSVSNHGTVRCENLGSSEGVSFINSPGAKPQYPSSITRSILHQQP